MLDRAKAMRPDGILLYAFQRNTGARRFYERHGFREIGASDGRDNEEREPDVLFEWIGAGDPI